jgi:hypothetical protein
MMEETDMVEIDKKIQLLKETVLELRVLGEKIPAVEKNANRILASIKMLEINVSDIVSLP